MTTILLPFMLSMQSMKPSLIDVNTPAVFLGRLLPRALGLVIEWASLQQAELLSDWQKAKSLEP